MFAQWCVESGFKTFLWYKIVLGALGSQPSDIIKMVDHQTTLGIFVLHLQYQHKTHWNTLHHAVLLLGFFFLGIGRQVTPPSPMFSHLCSAVPVCLILSLFYELTRYIYIYQDTDTHTQMLHQTWTNCWWQILNVPNYLCIFVHL